jgi:tape measure domain-containing protein
MPENLNWNFNLMNGVAGPAAEMAASLDILTKRLITASTNFDALDKSMKRMGSGAGVASGGLAKFGLELSAIKDIAAPFMEAGRFALEKGWDFEKASLHAIEFKENTLTSFQTLLGSAEKAQAFFNQASWLGRATPFKTEDVVKQFQSLLSAGFTQAEVPIVFQAVGDAAAQKGFSTDVMTNITNALSHAMASGGHNMGRVLQMLSFDAAGTGFQRGAFMKKLAKNMGMDTDGVEALLSSGEVSGRQFVKAFVDQMAETAGGGITGGGMKKMENNFRGILNTIEGSFGEMFFLNPGTADDIPGFAVLKGAMMNFRDVLNITTKEGKHLQDAVLGAFGAITNAVVGSLSGPEGMQAMKETVEKVAVTIENVGNIAGAAFSGIEAGVVTFASVLGLLDDFDGPLSPEKIDKIKTSMVEFGKEAGEAMGILAETLKGVFGAMLAGVKIAGALVEINTAPTAWDKQQAWGHFFEAFGHKKEMIEGKDWFQPGKDYAGTTYDTQGRPSATVTPGGGGASHYSLLPPVNVTIHSGHSDPAAVGAAAKSGVSSALQDHIDALHRLSSQAGHH